ncbi:MAG: TetR family transcriptional regulator [Betaproteobacteria bacterium]|nr:TetR family transcriptional regulator [Betaproteobacteria bacterium]
MDTRTRILDAALGLVAEGGVQELTQPRVSRAAGVRQSHLTYYFPTIADLVQAVARHTVDALVAEVGQRPRGRRAGALVEHIAAVTADKRRVRVMLALVSAADRDPALKPRLRELIRELRAGITGALGAAGIEAGADEVAFLHTVVVGTAVLQLARDDAPARRETRRVLQRAVAGLDGKG